MSSKYKLGKSGKVAKRSRGRIDKIAQRLKLRQASYDATVARLGAVRSVGYHCPGSRKVH